MFFRFIVLIALTALAVSGQNPQQQSYDQPANYAFNWNVQDDYTNNNFGQEESRNGDKTVGSYFVALPDGRIQRVTYTVDAYGGYQAEVTYEGTATYAQPTSGGFKSGNKYN